jgi:folate-binding protein YgfZ
MTDNGFWEALGGVGATDISHELLWVRGPDAVGFLDGLLSQNVAAMAPGTVGRSLLLAPNGKLRALLWLLRDTEDVGVVADVGSGGRVVSDLNRFKLRVDVELETDPIPLHSVVGPAAAAIAAGWSVADGVVTARADLTVPRYLATEVADGIAELSVELSDALRIESGEPRMGVDVDESTIPQESGLVDAAVDFDKGCYLGQELVARIHSRGHVNSRLAAVVVGDAPIAAGAGVVAAGKDVGVLTSVAWSPLLGARVGMGLLRREVEDDSAVEVRWDGDGAAGVVRSVPLRAH